MEQIKVKSPVELRLYDSQNRVTGLLNGEVSHGIPMFLYDDETVSIFFPEDSYRYEVVTTDKGAYGFEISSVREGKNYAFTLNNVPVSSGAVHSILSTGMRSLGWKRASL